jgi:hypothetical protein
MKKFENSTIRQFENLKMEEWKSGMMEEWKDVRFKLILLNADWQLATSFCALRQAPSALQIKLKLD